VPHSGRIQLVGNGAVRWLEAASDGTGGFIALARDLRRWWLDRTGTGVSFPWVSAQRSGQQTVSRHRGFSKRPAKWPGRSASSMRCSRQLVQQCLTDDYSVKERCLGRQSKCTRVERSGGCLHKEGNGTLPCHPGGTGGKVVVARRWHG
jgi:hypothetical protein